MGPGQHSVESSLGLATAPYADGDFTVWLPSQWTALSERPFCDLSWEYFIHAGWNSSPFCSKLTLLSTKQPQRMNETAMREDLAQSKYVSRGSFLCFPGFQENVIQPQRQGLGGRWGPASRGGLFPICSHPSQELHLPMEEKPDTCLPAVSESDPAFLFLVAETKDLAHSLLGLRQEALQWIFLRGSPEAGATRSWPAFLGLGLAGSALSLSQARSHGPERHQDLELRHRQLIPLSWPPQRICLVGLRLKPLNDSSCWVGPVDTVTFGFC